MYTSYIAAWKEPWDELRYLIRYLYPMASALAKGRPGPLWHVPLSRLSSLTHTPLFLPPRTR